MRPGRKPKRSTASGSRHDRKKRRLEIDLLPLEERLEALARLKEISNLVVSLRANLADYPANQYMIDNLNAERKTIMNRHIKAVQANPQ